MIRVAMLAPIAWRVPPRHYGPWEQFVSLLTEGLVARGVDVTLFATGDSVTTARLSSVLARGYEEHPGIDVKVWESLHVSQVFERAGEFDLIHNSFDFLPLTYSRLVATPTVTTIHGFSSERILPVYERCNAGSHYVSISDADRRPSLDYVATIHHGIDLAAFEPNPDRSDDLIFLGRIHPEKGTAEAIEVARRSGRRLVIGGPIHDQTYWEERIRPAIDGVTVRYLGSVGPAERRDLLGSAHALLHLISFDEPFGLSVVEAFASGTPVIAFDRGSMPELITDGRTGYLVQTVDQAVRAVAAIDRLDRRAIRAAAVDRFGQDRMVERYLDVYRTILDAPTVARGEGSEADA
jgi:glycosyltransferase involved in cell wall biosynthesis